MGWSTDSDEGDEENDECEVEKMTRSVIEHGRHGARRKRRTRKEWFTRSLIFANGNDTVWVCIYNRHFNQYRS
ncbi:unnamed protein product [Anisakis simplex]|uniref:Uncharacterized protein n=1 Tax=Anisakis simplex TaxID=6269 RepID=A0A0M3K2V2_ANISI|nr:unnamed protein product [Anisakis simplex]